MCALLVSTNCRASSFLGILGKAWEECKEELRSKRGFATRLKSPPTNRWGDKNLSRTSKKFRKKESLCRIRCIDFCNSKFST
ncbi:unnamed protein product [Staurois parvus]|uniref:Secreted protein n=1 Tax=Staurois parvus TaxID=386267 RepID=A0ABN9GWU8_9NEOB|nr:unnamed protein product [Staurois parvus]